jgi:DNA-binding beta-propeller fold protein YncE
MRTIVKLSALFIILLSSGNRVLHAQLKMIFESDAVFRHPESAVFDPDCSCFYVSNMDKDTHEDSLYTDFISAISPQGEVLELFWMQGLSSPTGMVLNNGVLAVVERNAIALINVQTRELLSRIPIAATGFLNDIAYVEDGVYFVSETSDAGKIYVVAGDKVEVFLEDTLFARPNGLMVDGNVLLIGVNGDHHLKWVDLNTKQVLQAVYLGPGNIDGIQKLQDGYLVSHFMGNLYKISANGTLETLLDTRGEDIFIADFAYHPERRLLVIPSLRTHKVYGYEYVD